MSKKGEEELIAFFKENGTGWWHHIPNFWLISDRRIAHSATSLRDKIKSIKGRSTNSPMIVMQIHEDITWAALFAGGVLKNPSTYDWLKSTNWVGE